MGDMRDRFPKRQLQPAARIDRFLHDRSGAGEAARERRIARGFIGGGVPGIMLLIIFWLPQA